MAAKKQLLPEFATPATTARSGLGLPPFECEHCAATFAQAGYLKKHISAVHLGLKPFECEHCAATFAEASKLKKHVSVHHTR